MTSPIADLTSENTRWLIEAFSLSSSADIFAHLCQGWCVFANADAVLIVQDRDTELLSCSASRGHLPEFTRRLLTNASPSPLNFDGVVSTLTTNFPSPLAVEGARRADEGESNACKSAHSPMIEGEHASEVSLIHAGHFVGRIVLFGSSQFPTWLCEATARILESHLTRERRMWDAKLEAMAEFAAGAGHEINNPVATISGRAQGLLREESHPERRRQLSTIGGQALRIRDMIGDAMVFARPPQPEPTELNLQSVIPKVLESFSEDFAGKECELTWDIPEAVPIFADRTQLAVVLTELVRNGLNCLEENGSVSISAETSTIKRQPFARFTVRDNGPGFTKEEHGHAFDPFYSARQAGRGLGFGLSKCWRIVSNHHGWIGVASLPSQGTCFTVSWPAYDFRSPNA